MTGKRLPDRPNGLDDLTRWNRAGLTRFDYIDGDAASWLEELRLALFGLYLRGDDPATRTPEHWRDLYLTAPDAMPAPGPVNDAAARVAWARLATAVQTRPETRGRRSERLLEQYAENTGDLGWETMRAFARATHVLLGHLNAYANEGYLRTATQWDNLRRLATMVNYQPTPPASAATNVSLSLKAGSGAVSVPRGLAMKYAPPEGGAPLIFETIESISAHEALNAARVEAWDINGETMDISGADPASGDPRTPFLIPEKAELAPGDLVILTAGSTGTAAAVAELARDTDAGTVKLAFADPAPTGWSRSKHATRLMTEPDAVTRGLPRTDSGKGSFFVAVESVAGFQPGDVVLIDGDPFRIGDVFGAGLRIETDQALTGTVTITQLAPLAMEGGEVVAPLDVTRMYFPTASGVERLDALGFVKAFYMIQTPQTGDMQERAAPMAPAETFTETRAPDRFVVSAGSVVGEYDLPEGSSGRTQLGWRFKPATAGLEKGFAAVEDKVEIAGKVTPDAEIVIPGHPAAPTRSVRFEGKPPKGLAAGAWYVARATSDDSLTALQVTGIRTAAGSYTVLFAQTISEAPETVEFHGPFTRALAPQGWNRNPDALPVETADLIDIPGEARALLKPGRAVLLTRDGTGEAIQGTLTRITDLAPAGGRARVRIDYTAPESAAGWTRGETVFHLNTAQVSHGETKGQKTLGSGDGERTGQAFLFAVGKISHIPSTIAESGVVPDIDVAVNGEVWPYADFIDPAAEGSKAWSSTLTEDGFLRIHFRRRLPTGSDNVTVQRHRVGVGARGSAIPARSFTEPMKKHRHVAAIVQPFATAGGADREPVAALRQSTPARLAANGRAVSLADFERLARRHSSVWRARAVEVMVTGAARHVQLTIVPAGGGALTETLKKDLRPVIADRAVPGVRLSFKAFESVWLEIGATIRVDLAAFDRTEVKRAAQDALYAHFALEVRDFGQAAHRAEILAALETVTGVETAVITRFKVVGLAEDADPGLPPPPGVTLPRRIARRDEGIAAIFPEPDQVAHVRPPGTGYPENTIEVVVEDAFGRAP